ncbi:MAG: mechanosensitive ion channel family protein [Bacteroidetes bacterium]|nr:mechanosensitive ion channel family protein [Bacteroidota bacterium]
MFDKFLQTFHLSLHGFIAYLPALIGGIACFIAALFIANFLSKIVSKYSLRRTKDPLIANFIGKIVWAVFFILGTVLALGILGLGTISNKILAGAGITTFVVGFALKDIGENFLAGLILAFSRPYHVGSLIECEEVKGIVRDMTLRQTTVESDEGKIILIPNSMIIKNPLSRYKDINELSQTFSINIATGDAPKAIQLIRDTMHSFDHILQTPEKPVKVIAEALNGDKVKVTVVFWFDTVNFKFSFSEKKSEIMLAVFEKLREADYSFSG